MEQILEGISIRKLKTEDLENLGDFLRMIGHDNSNEEINKGFSGRSKDNEDYIDIVAEDIDTSKIVGFSSLFIERKYIRGGNKVAHLETLIVAQAYRNRGIGKRIIESCLNMSKEKNCYKIITFGGEAERNFLSKFGFADKSSNMIICDLAND